MKTSLPRAAFAALVLTLALAFAGAALAQSERVKQKAKDLKKEVENGKPATNAPPQAPKPTK